MSATGGQRQHIILKMSVGQVYQRFAGLHGDGLLGECRVLRTDGLHHVGVHGVAHDLQAQRGLRIRKEEERAAGKGAKRNSLRVNYLHPNIKSRTDLCSSEANVTVSWSILLHNHDTSKPLTRHTHSHWKGFPSHLEGVLDE